MWGEAICIHRALEAVNNVVEDSAFALRKGRHWWSRCSSKQAGKPWKDRFRHKIRMLVENYLKWIWMNLTMLQWWYDDHTVKHRSITSSLHESGGADPTLEKTIPAGIAFHHSGLTTEERNVIERGYKSGHINAICATSTLAAGVNLPARRVVFQTPFMGNQLLDATQYKQMAGRAGRAGQGTVGESILISPANTKRQVMVLVQQQLPRVASCLRNELRGLKRLLLEVLCVVPQLGAGEDLIRFSLSTLLMTQKSAPDESLEPAQRYPEIAEAVKWLLAHDMARLDERSNAYRATPLGHAVCASGLEPQQGQLLFQEMQQARSCISLDTDLHVCYLVTPDSLLTVDWNVYKKVLCHLCAAERRVAQRIKLRHDLVDQAQFQGRLPNSTLQSVDGQRIVRQGIDGNRGPTRRAKIASGEIEEDFEIR